MFFLCSRADNGGYQTSGKNKKSKPCHKDEIDKFTCRSSQYHEGLVWGNF